MDADFLYVVVGQRIRDERHKRGLKQERLAAHVSLTRTSITNIECGRQKILLHTLYAIAEALDIPPQALLPDLSQASPEPRQEITLPEDMAPNEKAWFRSIVDPSSRK